MLFILKSNIMVQLNQNKENQVLVPMDFVLNEKTAKSINYLLLGLRYAMKALVKEAVEEVLDEREFKALDEDRTITARELCERWSISPNTLRSWEIDGKIAPLPLNGRKKIYSMRDVLAAEATGYIKNVS